MDAFHRRDLYASVAVGLGASLYLLILAPVFDVQNFYVAGQEIMSNDQVGYLTSARWLAETGELRNHLIFPATVREPNWRLYMPGQYYVLAAGHLAFGDGPIAWRLPSMLAFVVSAVGVFLIGRRFYDTESGGVAAVLFAAFSPIAAFAFTAMPQLPFIAACVVAFALFAYLPERARPVAVPFLLALPFLFRETGAFVIIPMLLVMVTANGLRGVRRALVSAAGAVGFLSALLYWQVASGKGSLPLDAARFNYANAFAPTAPTFTWGSWLAGLGANVSRNLDVLANHLARLDYVIVPLAVLTLVAGVALVRGVRRDWLALGASLLFVLAVGIVSVFYTWERYRGLRAVLFTVPLLAVSVAPWVSSLLIRGRSRRVQAVALAVVLAVGYWGSGRMARGVTSTDGARAVEALRSLELDARGVLIAPTSLSLDYVLRSYPLRWSYIPSNRKTLELVASLHDVRTVIVREDDLGRRLSEADIEAVGLKRTRSFEHRVFHNPATFLVFEKPHRDSRNR